MKCNPIFTRWIIWTPQAKLRKICRETSGCWHIVPLAVAVWHIHYTRNATWSRYASRRMPHYLWQAHEPRTLFWTSDAGSPRLKRFLKIWKNLMALGKLKFTYMNQLVPSSCPPLQMHQNCRISYFRCYSSTSGNPSFKAHTNGVAILKKGFPLNLFQAAGLIDSTSVTVALEHQTKSQVIKYTKCLEEKIQGYQIMEQEMKKLTGI